MTYEHKSLKNEKLLAGSDSYRMESSLGLQQRFIIHYILVALFAYNYILVSVCLILSSSSCDCMGFQPRRHLNKIYEFVFLEH